MSEGDEVTTKRKRSDVGKDKGPATKKGKGKDSKKKGKKKKNGKVRSIRFVHDQSMNDCVDRIYSGSLRLESEKTPRLQCQPISQ